MFTISATPYLTFKGEVSKGLRGRVAAVGPELRGARHEPRTDFVSYSLRVAPGVFDTFCFRLIVEVRMHVVAALRTCLLFFHLHWMGLGIGVVPRAGNLPRDFPARLAARDLETVAGHF